MYRVGGGYNIEGIAVSGIGVKNATPPQLASSAGLHLEADA